MKERRRIIAGRALSAREWERFIKWAALKGYDAVIVSLREKSLWKKIQRRKGIFKIAERHDIAIEAGGWDLSLLLPRRRFFFHRDLFRMDSGRRSVKYNFCPTNHKTVECLKQEAAKLFSRAAGTSDKPSKKGKPGVVNAEVFHLWPDRGHERTWCACPACRAFSPAEQNRIAVNAAAGVLAQIAPQVRLSYLEIEDEAGDGPAAPPSEGTAAGTDIPAGNITPAENVFAIKEYPDEWNI